VPKPVDATEVALRALRHRNRSRSDLDERLQGAGVAPDEREAALDRLAESGLLSDDRFAEERARVLVRRGAGDALIRQDLRRAGVDHSTVEHAIAQLEPEDERAVRIFERRGADAKALRYLGRQGFAAETLERLTARDALE
jgi:regulatory protein